MSTEALGVLLGKSASHPVIWILYDLIIGDEERMAQGMRRIATRQIKGATAARIRPSSLSDPDMCIPDAFAEVYVQG